jgi:hypothetical protein
MPVDQTKINGVALALCAVDCPESKPKGTCEHLCEAARDPKVWNCSHMKRMRVIAQKVLEAPPATEPPKVQHTTRRIHG